MPGMMDTVLNIGLNDQTVEALVKQSGNERFAWDSYRRFVQMYGDVVLDLKPKSKEDHDPFEEIGGRPRRRPSASPIRHRVSFTAEHLKELVAEFKQAIKRETGKEFPTDPMEQVSAIYARVRQLDERSASVLSACTYNIPHEWGTAVNVQAMVFGNLGDDCATGVAMTRDVALGLPGLNGDYLINAQGEDVVAGIRTPLRIEETLESQDMPAVLQRTATKSASGSSKSYKDVQDIEFTVQRGKVWMLQTRNAKRTGFAAVRIAVDLVNEGLIDKGSRPLAAAPSGCRPTI